MTKESESLTPHKIITELFLDFTRRARADKLTTEEEIGGSWGWSRLVAGEGKGLLM